MRQLLLIAFRSLFQHRWRTGLLGAAILVVTALLILVVGLVNGIQETMVTSATTLMTGHVNVAGFYKVTAGQAAPVVTDIDRIQEIVKKEVPELDYIAPRGRGWAKLVSETASLQVGIGGIDIDKEPGFRKVIQVKSGNLDELRKPNTIMLFADQARKLEAKVGDKLTVSAPTPRGTSNTVDVTIAAIASDMGLVSSFNTYMQDGALRQLYQLSDRTTGALHVYLKDVGAAKRVQERLRLKLAEAGFGIMDDDPNPFWVKFPKVNRENWTGQKLDITQWEDEISFMTWTLKLIGYIAGFLIVVLMIIISVGLMNVMWISVRERTREVGTLRAIGMQRTSVLAMFVSEAFLLGLLGTTAGTVAGLAISYGLNAAHLPVPVAVQLFLMTDHLSVSPAPGLIALFAALIVASITLVSLIPSFLAARMKPITAMHHIG